MDRIDGDECCEHCVMDVEGACPHVVDGVHAYPCDAVGCVAHRALDIPAFPAWPEEKNGYSQTLAVCDGHGGAYTRHGFNPHEPFTQSEVAAHGVRDANWSTKENTNG